MESITNHLFYGEGELRGILGKKKATHWAIHTNVVFVGYYAEKFKDPEYSFSKILTTFSYLDF